MSVHSRKMVLDPWPRTKVVLSGCYGEFFERARYDTVRHTKEFLVRVSPLLTDDPQLLAVPGVFMRIPCMPFSETIFNRSMRVRPEIVTTSPDVVDHMRALRRQLLGDFSVVVPLKLPAQGGPLADANHIAIEGLRNPEVVIRIEVNSIAQMKDPEMVGSGQIGFNFDAD